MQSTPPPILSPSDSAESFSAEGLDMSSPTCLKAEGLVAGKGEGFGVSSAERRGKGQY